MLLREHVEAGDAGRVRRLVESTGFFRPAEVAIAVELVEDGFARGKDSDYRFLFEDGTAGEGALQGYACYGRIPGTEHGFDLYWIAVAPERQRHGTGRRLMAAVEDACRLAGGRAIYIDTSGRESYAPTRAFYEAAGYEPVATFPDFYADGDSKVVYRKRLDQVS